ncbi:hypothetical protein DL93DRAFT_2166337 [Clavulina sp. PMI_390]|nr:hypothetical protein DL93DRAFT_2166337 [Clavulina sp. PMI_390]
MSSFHGINLNRALASYVFGEWASSFLFGVITVQTHLYYQKFPRDPIHSRLLVGLLWSIQGAEVGILSYALYETFGSPAGALQLLVQPWYLSYYGTHGVMVACMVQSFFVSRYWIGNASSIYPRTRIISLDVTVESYLSPQSSFNTLAAIDKVLTAWLTLTTFTDITVAATLAFEMRKRRTGFFKTDSMLNRVAIYGVATGAVTATIVTIQLLLYTVADMLEPILFFGMPLGGIYIATFLANLHTRSSLRGMGSDAGAIELSPVSATLPRTDVTVTSVVLHARDL